MAMENEDRGESHIPRIEECNSGNHPDTKHNHPRESMTSIQHLEVSTKPMDISSTSSEQTQIALDNDQVQLSAEERVIDTKPTGIREHSVRSLDNGVGLTSVGIDLTEDVEKSGDSEHAGDHALDRAVIEELTTKTNVNPMVDPSSGAGRFYNEPNATGVSTTESRTVMTASAKNQDKVLSSDKIIPRVKEENSPDDIIDMSRWPEEIVILVDDDVTQTSEAVVVPDVDETPPHSTIVSASEAIVIQDDNVASTMTDTTKSTDHKRVLLMKRKPMTAGVLEKRLQIQQQLIRRHQASQTQNMSTTSPTNTSADVQLNTQVSKSQEKPLDAYSGEQSTICASTPSQQAQRGSPGVIADLEPWDEEEDPLQEYQAALPRAKAAEAIFKEARKNYKAAKRAGVTTREDDIKHLTLTTGEKIRLKHFNDLKARVSQVLERAPEAPENSDDENDDSLFVPIGKKDGSSNNDPLLRPGHSNLPNVSCDGEAPRQRRKRKQPNKVSEEAIFAGMEEERIKEMRKAKQGRGNGVAKPSSKGSKRKTKDDKVTKPRKKGRPQQGSKLFKNFDSLFTSNVYTDGNRKFGVTLPTSTQKNKRKALNEIIAAIPLDDRRIATQDSNALIVASKTLGLRQCHRDPSGDWKFNGMKSLLRPHQVLAAAHMKEREDGITQPAGGILADEMGFGKTVTTIATIIANPPSKDEELKTTLIVVPASILHQWEDEIWAHGERDRIGRCVIYHSSQRIDGPSSDDIYKDCDVILTTYREVVRSYPKFDPPQELMTFHHKREWFKKQLEEHRGLLHRLNFYRIVLDEAQAIKNYQSQTSKAVRALDAKFRWAISGTPILNAVDELYPYFKFLRVKCSGSIDVFRKNFCQRGTDICNERVQVLLKSFMIRRDHADTLMGEKIVTLPENHVTTVAVTFNATERAVYDTIQKRFIERINSYCKAGNIKLKYNNVLTMLLTLRQLCSHLYLVQDTIEDIFRLEDFEKLWALTADEVATSDGSRSRDMLAEMSRLFQAQGKAPGAQAAPPNPEEEASDQQLQATRPLVFRFRQHLRDLAASANFSELRNRSVCAKCRDFPLEPHITSCQHLYCRECLKSIAYESSVRHEDKNECLACGSLFETAIPCPALRELGFDDAGSRVPDSSNEEGSQAGSTAKRSQRWIESNRAVTPSSKAAAVLAQITSWLQEAPACKIIIFTQFRLMITVLGRLCKDRDLGYCVFHGGQNHSTRNTVIKDFRDKEETHIMIASLKCGGVGLNLTMANRVICIDPWWNSPVERQAFCRVYRIGQTQETYVTRIVVKETVDDRLLKMQEDKAKTISEAMGEEGKRMGKLSVKELMRLFGTLSDDNEDEDGPDFIIVEDDPEEISGVDDALGQEQPGYEDVIMLD